MHLSELKPNPKNPRIVTPEKLEMLKRSLAEFGDLSGIVYNKRTRQIVGGHQRASVFDAASVIEITKKYDKPTKTGTIAEGHILVGKERYTYREVNWDEVKEKAANIAANKGVGEWDMTELGSWMKELQSFNFDLDLTMFDADERLKFFESSVGAKDAAEEFNITPEQQKKLDLAYREWCSEILQGLSALSRLATVGVGMGRTQAKIHFLCSLFAGKEFPRFATIGYQPQRLSVAGDKLSALDGIKDVANGKIPPRRLRFILQEKPSWEKFLKGGLPFCGARQPLDFPAELARDLIDEFTPKGGAILDPCHGWGGRLVGFLLSKRGAYYTGFDPSPEAHKGLAQMGKDFLPYCKGKQSDLHCVPFEDSKLPKAHFDFALTSPPYFDVEKYTGKESSHVRYKSFDVWNQRFYRLLIEKTFVALKPGGTFALQVGNQTYPLEAEAKSHAEHVGFEYVETRQTEMFNNQMQTEPDRGECVVIFKKPKTRQQTVG
jgi:hypothetical protein